MKLNACWRVVAFACIVSVAPFARADADKLPIPSQATQALATKHVNDLFKNDVSSAKTPDAKSALAKKLIATGSDEQKEMPAKFALLTLADETACSAGDLDTASRAIDLLDETFSVGVWKMRMDAVETAAKAARTADIARPFCTQAGALARLAVAAEEFKTAQSIAEAQVQAAHFARDTATQREAAAQLQGTKSAAAAFGQAQQAAAVLKSKPDDPAANLEFGTYLCFTKNDWAKGLPLLGKGSDASLRSIAAADANGDADTALALGDAWWDLAEKNAGATKAAMQRRAAKWYQDAEPRLTGLTKRKVENRLGSIADAAAGDPGKVVNLLQLMDISKDAVRGKWVKKDGALVADLLDVCSFGFPYKPPDEYDYRIGFTRLEGHGSIQILCAAFGHQFNFNMDEQADSTVCGFFLINGRAHDNASFRKIPGAPKIGSNYKCIVKVRKTGVKAYLNGELVSEWKTDFSDFGIGVGWELPHNNICGLGEWGPRTAFDSVDIVEVNGHGERLQRK